MSMQFNPYVSDRLVAVDQNQDALMDFFGLNGYSLSFFRNTSR